MCNIVYKLYSIHTIGICIGILSVVILKRVIIIISKTIDLTEKNQYYSNINSI